jgi:hypothetical protein
MRRRIDFRRFWTISFALTAVIAVGNAPALAQLPFFPGAEGFGGNFTGTAPAAGWFSNATVYHVTNLNDSGAGSLRGAFVENTSNKIIVFDVGGVIQLSSGSLDIKNVQNYYIAGQTAPSPVTIYGDTTQITHSNNKVQQNVVLRYLTFRKGTGNGEDAITFAGGGTAGIATNMIMDHVSGSWAEDEVLSVANYNSNVTVQYSVIADSLTSGHAYGSLIRPRTDANVSFHHNLYANNASRQARFGTYDAETLTADFRNNVIYNWRDRASYAGGSSEDEQEFADVNYVGNYLVAGSGTVSNANLAFHVDKNVDARVYQSGNFIDSDKQVNPGGVPNGVNTGWGMFQISSPVTDQTLTQMATPFATAPVTTQTATNAYDQVIDYVGNAWWSREAIDARIINNVLTNTGPPNGIAAAAPNAAELSSLLATPISNRPAGYDTDNDGMSNEWELKHGLNTGATQDAYLDFDNDGYVNIVEFVNELGEFPAPAPIVFNGGLNNRYAHVLNWKTNDGGVTAGSNWQPSKYDEAQINSGTVVVDAVGQHAGVLKLGATAGSNGQLQVNSGWLEVADTIVVGAHATGEGKLTLGGGAVKAEEVVVGFLGQLTGSGTLTANVTNGGAVLPGSSPGTLTIAGDYTQISDGVLSIDLASAGSFDKLVVNSNVQLAGLLEVNLLGGYEPALGATFDVLDWTGSASGAFELLVLPDLDAALAWDTSLLDAQGVLSVIAAPSDALAGDYNDDGFVDAADYSIWRDNLGSNAPLLNETESVGVVDAADFEAWKANFGAVAELGSGGLSAVPEPGTLCLLLIVMTGFTFRRRRAEKARNL